MPSWLVSMVVHAVLLMILALVTLPEKGPLEQIVAIANLSDETEEIEDFQEEEIEPVNVETFDNTAPLEMADLQPTEDDMNMPDFDDMDAAPMDFKLEDFGDRTAPRSNLTDRLGVVGGTGLEGRGSEGAFGDGREIWRHQGQRSGGGHGPGMAGRPPDARRRLEFRSHQRGPCKGRCTNAGQIAASRNGATAMALLPFLGAGQTHKEGKYKETVERGAVLPVEQHEVRNGMGDL